MIEWLTLLEQSPWYPITIAAILAVLISLLIYRAGRILLISLTESLPITRAAVQAMHRPAGWVLPIVALRIVTQGAPDSLAAIDSIRHNLTLLLIAALAWLATRAIAGIANGLATKYPVDIEDNLRARRLLTLTRVLSRIAIGVVILTALAMMLLTFPGARRIGTSLLASAGLIGIIAGFAAKPVLSNLIAGLQIAMSQPIRLDDVLVVEGEWGRVEEITGAFVVLRIWDDRRLILPLSYFIEKPFQNWTRRTSQLLGSVFFYVDYRTPVAALRNAVEAIVKAAPEWDGRFYNLQVTDATERGLQLRILCTAKSSSAAFDLRCRVREGMIDFLQREYPECLPRLRVAPETGSADEK